MNRQFGFGPVVQLVRTLACHARGRGFEPHPGRFKKDLSADKSFFYSVLKFNTFYDRIRLNDIK